MIAIGWCHNSNGIHFYNPVNGSFVSSIDYKFHTHSTSGARFGYKYQPSTFIYRLDESTTTFTPKFALDSDVLVHTHSPLYVAKVLIDVLFVVYMDYADLRNCGLKDRVHSLNWWVYEILDIWLTKSLQFMLVYMLTILFISVPVMILNESLRLFSLLLGMLNLWARFHIFWVLNLHGYFILTDISVLL
jgi:hypothetical protein